MSSLKSLEARISKIEKRNSNVSADKAWETSLFRKILIALLTYLIIGFYCSDTIPQSFQIVDVVITSKASTPQYGGTRSDTTGVNPWRDSF